VLTHPNPNPNPNPNSASLDDAISLVDSIEDLVRIIPKSFQSAFTPLLKEIFDRAIKVTNVQSSLALLEMHRSKGTFPANIYSSLKIPVIQVSKEFSGSSVYNAFQEACRTTLHST
jgi:hypothetical protein